MEKSKEELKEKLMEESKEKPGKWACKKCGGKMRVSLSRVINEDFDIDKDGEPTGQCLRKIQGEADAGNYYCSKCKVWYDDGVELSDIAEWKEGD